MRFLYEYRTADNVRHHGELSAKNREDAYAVLKGKSIKPSRLVEAPGIFNKVFGKGKRWIVICVLSVAVAVLLVQLTRDATTDSLWQMTLDSRVRRQIVGETALIEHGIRTGWSSVFQDEADQFFASFAIPGANPAVKNVTESSLVKAMSRHVECDPTDSIEARQIKSIVEGMKDEANAYFAAGGKFEKYLKRLNRRQREEIGYYTQISNELYVARSRGLSKEELESLWERRNISLGSMGIKLVPLPE